MICDDVHVEQYIGYDTSVASSKPAHDRYKSALVTLHFSRPFYDMTGNTPMLEFDWSSSEEGVTMPNSSLKYNSANKPIQQDCMVPLVVDRLSVTIHNMQSRFPAALANARSYPMNSAIFYTNQGSYPVGTVVLLSVNQRGQVPSNGSASYSLTVNFKMRAA